MNTQEVQSDEMFCWLVNQRELCFKRELGDGGEGNTPQYWYDMAKQFELILDMLKMQMCVNENALDALHNMLMQHEGRSEQAIADSFAAIEAIKEGRQP
jgi:hypothetical protein